VLFALADKKNKAGQIDSRVKESTRGYTPGGGLKAGLTLIELLVVLVLTTVVGGAALSLYLTSVRQSMQQQTLLDQDQNLRAALYTMTRDVRMAGNGLRFIGNEKVQIYIDPSLTDPNIQEGSGWFQYKGAAEPGVRAAFGHNGNVSDVTGGTDTLTIFYSGNEGSLALGSLSQGYTPGDTSIFLRGGIGADTLTEGDMISITSGALSVILQVKSFSVGASETEIVIGERFKPGAPLPGGIALDEGSQVMNLREVTFVTYYVDTVDRRLMASYMNMDISNVDDFDDASRHAVMVAENIEDMQIAYYMNSTAVPPDPPRDTITEGDFTGSSWVKGISVSLVARAANKVEASQKAGPIKQVRDHVIAGPSDPQPIDGYFRRVLTEDINMRNY